MNEFADSCFVNHFRQGACRILIFWLIESYVIWEVCLGALKTRGLLLLLLYLNCKWVFTRWQGYYNKARHTNNTHHKKNNTPHSNETQHTTVIHFRSGDLHENHAIAASVSGIISAFS
jgi:Ca2+/Na+ antiporter